MPNKKSWKVERVDLYASSNQDVPSGVGYDIVGLQASSAGFFYKDDAHLIAAAPEMLAEVIRLRDRVKALCEYPRTRFIQNECLKDSHLEETDALIAKAEGASTAANQPD